MFIHGLIGFLEASNILYFVDDNTKLIIEINDIHVCYCFLSHRIEKNNNEKVIECYYILCCGWI